MKTKRKNKKRLHYHIKLAVMPRKANHYRPHLVRRYGLAIVLLLVLVFHAGYNFSMTGSVLGDKTSMTQDALLTETNVERQRHALKPLVINERLARAAQLKADDMFRQQYWAHTAPDGKTPWGWIDTAGYQYAYAGENLAKNFRTAGAAVVAWMSSPEHKANILGGHYSDVGFAVAEGEFDGRQTAIVVALYGAPAGESSVLAAQPTSAAPTLQSMSLVGRLGVIVQSVTPAAVGSIVLLLLAAVVAFAAHAYRNKLPQALKKSWYRHHGAIKAGGMVSLCVVIIILYSSGQI